MKKKLSILLMALFAFTAFQANAQKDWWINAGDPAHFTGSGSHSPYAWEANLVGKLTADGGTFKYSPDPLVLGAADKVTLEKKNPNFVQFSKGGKLLALSYNKVNYDRFVPYLSSGVSAGIQTQTYSDATGFSNTGGLTSTKKGAYLAVQTGDNVLDDNLILIAIKVATGDLELKTWGEIFKNGKYGEGYVPLYIELEPIAGRWLRQEDLAKLDCAKGSPNKYVKFSSVTKDLSGKLLQGLDTCSKDFFEIFEISYYAPHAVLDNVNYKETLNTAGTGIDLFQFRSPEDTCKYLTTSRRNKIDTQWSTNKSAFGDQFDLENEFKGVIGNDLDNPYLQKYAIWMSADGDYEIYPAAAVSIKHGQPVKPVDLQDPEYVLNNAIEWNRFPGRNDAWPDGGGALGTDEDATYFRVGWYDGSLSKNPTQSQSIAVIPNTLQQSTTFKFLQFDMVCNTFVNKIDPTKWKFMQVDYSHIKNRLTQYAIDEMGGTPKDEDIEKWLKERNLWNRDWVISTTSHAGSSYKELIITPKEEIIRIGEKTEEEYWKNNVHDSVNMAAHWQFAAAKDGGYIIFNMLGDTIVYNDKNMYQLAGGFCTNNAEISNRIKGENITYTNGTITDPDGTWYIPNTRKFDVNATPQNSYYIWNTVSYKKDSKEFFLALPNSKGAEWVMNVIDWQGPAKAEHDDYINWWIQAGDPTYCKGLTVTLEDIYYVPEYAGSYESEGEGTINTSDPKYVDPDYKLMNQDSLTAYLYLNGTYDFKEAQKVLNELTFQYETVALSATESVDQAKLAIRTKEDPKLSVIPLVFSNAKALTTDLKDESTTMSSRAEKLKGLATALGIDNKIDYLYGENYKWFLIKDDQGRYLVYDTVSYISNRPNREKVGLTFQEVDPINATPVRLYQPLVGDKTDGNFTIQFYSPKYKYAKDKDDKWKAYLTSWPNVESIDNKTKVDGGKLLFAYLNAQSNFIFSTEDRQAGTRFTYVWQEPQPENCCQDLYVEPDWAFSKRLLGLPLGNRAFTSEGVLTKSGMTVDADTYATLTEQSTDIVHELVGYIDNGVFYDYDAQGTDSKWFPANSAVRGGFTQNKKVAVYTVQNSDGKFLTVCPHTKQKTASTTIPDVTGTSIGWRERYAYDKDMFATNSANPMKPLTQYYAIVDLCQNGDDTEFAKTGGEQRFVYLPLASYLVNYPTGTVIKDKFTAKDSLEVLRYNTYLGSTTECGGELGADVTKAFRIGQYNVLGSNRYDMVVVGASGGNLTSNIPVEFAWTPKEYELGFCDYQLVYKNITIDDCANFVGYCGIDCEEGSYNQYYTINGKVYNANQYSLAAHWAVKEFKSLSADEKAALLGNYNVADDVYKYLNDPFLTIFDPEIKKMYGKDVTPTELRGFSYMRKLSSEEGKKYNVAVYKFPTDPKKDHYRITKDTLTFECVKHDLPFYDLEADGGFEILMNKLAIFEAIYLDRNIYTDFKASNIVTNTVDATKEGLLAYRALVKDASPESDEEVYLRAYRSFRRELTPSIGEEETHVIPYYVFSIEDAKGVEYFMNVKPSQSGRVQDLDSVRFSALTKNERDLLLSEKEADNYKMPLYKFCLPYDQVTKDRVDPNKVEQPLLIQSLDVAPGNDKIDQAPYLVIIGAGSDFVTARHIPEAFNDCLRHANTNYQWSIYTMDYSQLDSEKITSWTFWGSAPEDNEWVRLAYITDDKDRYPDNYNGKILTDPLKGDGVFANAMIENSQYMAPSKETVNYAKLVSGPYSLDIYFVGDTLIGDVAKRPIWYYKIQDPAGKGWLTDAKDSIGSIKDSYWFTWGEGNYSYPYGFFGSLLSNEKNYVDQGILADKTFAQTFGLRYVEGGVDSDPENNIYQRFRIVSHANYTTKVQPSKHYRYLANVQGRFVFVDNEDDAMIFSFGRPGEDGKWVNIDDATSAFAVVAVNGAVKVSNAEGTVEIYTTDGRLVSSTPIISVEQTISAPNGIVIVKNGANVKKVVVK